MAETCPMCKSSDPKVRWCGDVGRRDGSPHETFCPSCVECRDPWHDAKEEKMADLIKSESNSVTYGKPTAGDECDNPDRCPHCNGYHLGGCHRAPAQATREQLEAALRECVESIRWLPKCPHPVGSAVICDYCQQSREKRLYQAIGNAERLLGGK